jgi:hypothetical protein
MSTKNGRRDLWLATDRDHCQLKAGQDAVDRGLVDASWKMNTPALASGGSLAYRARMRPVDVEGTAFEFGAYGTAHAARNSPNGWPATSGPGTANTATDPARS